MENTWQWLLGLVAADATPWVLSLAIIMGAIAIFTVFRLRAERLMSSIRRLTRRICDTQGPIEFKQRYPTIFAEFAEDAVLGAGWRRFATTLHLPPASDHPIGYVRRPQSMFDEAFLARNGLDLRFFLAVPNYLVGIGLLFSFAGLAGALYFAGQGVAAASVGDAQSALRELLAVASFKFATSIAGLLASILFSLGEKRVLFALDGCLQAFADALEERMLPLSSEGLLATQSERLRSIDQQLNKLSRAVYVRVPEALEATLADELREALHPLKQSIRNAGQHLENNAAQSLNIFAERDAANQAGLHHDMAQQPADSARSEDAILAAADSIKGPGTSELQQGVTRGEASRRFGELARLADARLRRLLEGLEEGLERFRGGGFRRMRTRLGELEALLESTHDAARDARKTVAAMHEQLAAGSIGPEQALAALDEVDRILGATRQRLHKTATGDPEPTLGLERK